MSFIIADAVNVWPYNHEGWDCVHVNTNDNNGFANNSFKFRYVAEGNVLNWISFFESIEQACCFIGLLVGASYWLSTKGKLWNII